MKDMRKLKLMPNSYEEPTHSLMCAWFLIVFVVGVFVIDLICGMYNPINRMLYFIYGVAVSTVILLNRKYRRLRKSADNNICKQAISVMTIDYILFSVTNIVTEEVLTLSLNVELRVIASVIPVIIAGLVLYRLVRLEARSIGSWRLYSDGTECTGNRRDYIHIKNGVKINLYNGTTLSVDLESQSMDFVGTHTLVFYENLNVTEAVPVVYTTEDVRDIEIISLSGEITRVFLGSKRFSVQTTEGTE